MKQQIKTIANRLARHAGVGFYRIPKGSKVHSIKGSNENTVDVNSEYAAVQPLATFSPWMTDISFQKIHAEIKKFTMVDIFRCYELWKLIEQSAKLKSGAIIEIGVWRGGTGALMAKQAKNCGIVDRVFLCDTFAGVVKAGPNDQSYIGREHADTSKEIAEDLIFKRMSLDNVEILEGIFPDQTGRQIEAQQFRFCHVDVDVYQSAKDIVDWIWSKMIPGGLVVYDDYGFKGAAGIRKYVEEQMNLKDRLVFHNLNGHAIVVKL